MKRKLSLLLCLACLWLCACGAKAETTPAATAALEPTPEITPVPEPTPTPVPETTGARVIVPRAPALLGKLKRGDTVELLDELEEYYVVAREGQLGLMEQKLLRPAEAESFESYEAYAGINALSYPDYHLRSSEGSRVELNTALTVLDELGDLALVQLGEEQVYMPLSMISLRPCAAQSGSASGDSVSTDGEDIYLGTHMGPRYELRSLATFVENPGTSSGSATVLADGAELIGALFELDESVRVMTVGENECTLLVNGAELSMERRFLQLEGEEAYAVRTAYADGHTAAYGNICLSGESETLGYNEEVTVLWDFGDCCLIRYQGEKLGFVTPDSLSEQKYSYNGNVGGSDWTVPVL